MVGKKGGGLSIRQNQVLKPTLEVIRRLAVALGVSADVLIFAEHERDPGEDLRLQFEKMNQFSPDEKKVAKAVLEGLILKHEAKKWGSSE